MCSHGFLKAPTLRHAKRCILPKTHATLTCDLGRVREGMCKHHVLMNQALEEVQSSGQGGENDPNQMDVKTGYLSHDGDEGFRISTSGCCECCR